MAKLILLTCSILVLVNSLTGLLLSKYLFVNWLLADFILIINSVLFFRLYIDKISNGYKISLSFVFTIMCLISIILAVNSTHKIYDNLSVVGLIFIIFFEVLLFFIAKKVNTSNNNYQLKKII